MFLCHIFDKHNDSRKKHQYDCFNRSFTAQLVYQSMNHYKNFMSSSITVIFHNIALEMLHFKKRLVMVGLKCSSSNYEREAYCIVMEFFENKVINSNKIFNTTYLYASVRMGHPLQVLHTIFVVQSSKLCLTFFFNVFIVVRYV